MSAADDKDLLGARKGLRKLLGNSVFEKYAQLIDAFLTGKLVQREADLGFRTILDPSGPAAIGIFPRRLCGKLYFSIELHNHYVSLVLEKIARIESAIKEEEGTTLDDARSASFNPRHISLTKQESTMLCEALAKAPIVQLTPRTSRQALFSSS